MDDTAMWSAWARGAGLYASLIVAIGAQNAYLLRQGLRRRHVLTIVLLCVTSDALLIGAGVAGMGAAMSHAPRLLTLIRWAGAAYLGWFALGALRRALARESRALHAGGGTTESLTATVVTTLALTFINPHVYLDIAVLGAIGGREVGYGRLAFAAGAISASVTWFFAMGYGARLLAPLFAKPRAWRVLDGAIGLMVLVIAASLLR